MELLVNTLFNLINNSNGFWMTDNDDINGDQDDIYLEKDNNSIYLMYEDNDMRIKFADLLGITYENFANMIIAIIKIQNRKNLMVHIL